MSERDTTVQTKVFISYSRKDQAFTRELYASLAEAEVVTWVDWEGIPLTADWMAEIRDAIESADAFICVISPDALDSEVVAQELEIAVNNHKRLIPIVREQPRDDQFPNLNKHLAATNWVFLRADDDYGATIKSLIDAIKMDLDWVKAHTRLQARGLEWERKERDTSFTLRGVDLEQAESWLASNNHERIPQPTMLHNEYILVSRREELGRQRFVRNVILGALVLSVILAVLAVTQWINAEQQARIAISRQLAAQALINQDSAPDLAPLLSIEALNFQNNVDTRTSLLALLARNPQLKTMLHGHEGGINGVAYDPQGRWIVTVDTERLIYFWDPETGELAEILGSYLLEDASVGPMVATHHTGVIHAAAFSPSGRYLATGDANGTIIIWDVDELSVFKEWTAHSSAVNALVFRSEFTLLSGGADSLIRQWRVDINEPEMELQGHTGSVLTLAYEPNQGRLASGNDNGELYIWDLDDETPAPLALEAHSGEVNAAAFSPDGRLLASAGRDLGILLWNAGTGGLLQAEGDAHIANILTLAFSHDGLTLASSGEDRVVTLWSVFEDQLHYYQSFRAHTNFVRGVAFSSDDRTVVSGGVDQLAMIWHVQYPGYGPLEQTGGALRRVVFSHDGEMLAYSGQDNTLYVLEAQAGFDVIDPISAPGAVFGMDFSGDDRLLAYADLNGNLNVIDTFTGERVQQNGAHGSSSVFAVAFSPDGTQVASGGISTDLVLWDLDSGATQSLTGHSAFIRWIDYSPQGTVIATVAWDGQLMLWDRATGERYPIVHSDSVAGETELGLSVHGVDELLYVEFSPTGQYLATTSSDHTAIIWEVDYLAEQGVRLTRLITLRGHTDWVHAATFNQAETMVATASQDNKIFLWSLVNTPDYSVGEKIAELTGHRDSVNAIDFSPDGLRLASGSTDGAVIIWNIDVARAPLILCEQVNRDLTEDEWLERIGTGREYHPTCLEYTGGETIEE